MGFTRRCLLYREVNVPYPDWEVYKMHEKTKKIECCIDLVHIIRYKKKEGMIKKVQKETEKD